MLGYSFLTPLSNCWRPSSSTLLCILYRHQSSFIFLTLLVTHPSSSCALSYVTTSLRSHSSSSVFSTILYPSSSFYIILDSSIIFHSRLSTFMPLRLSQFPSTEPNTYFTTSVFKISFLSSSLSSKICSIRLFRILLFLSF